ncbi:hypothetical protein L7F22_036062 [Adiantum nelumboides]|nr:hypothetical protein [Adiantum nelumboides]MCO5582172.1 hypothetical protein [Adiantum nelumboides]
MATSKFSRGGQEEDIVAWFRLVECEFAQLELYDDESQADYAWKGLLYDACYLYSMLSEDEQWSWQSMKRALFLAFYDPPELFCNIENDMHAGIVTFHDEGYESDEEASSCSDGGETVDDELKSTESTSYLSSDGNEMEVMHEETSGLTVAEDLYDVYKDALELKSQQEGDVCEEVVQVAGFFDDYVFFDSLMSEAGDDAFFSSSLDSGMLENVTCECFDHLLDEEVPLAIIIVAPKKNDACADVFNVFNGAICLLAGMYAFQCLLKATFVAHDGVTGVSKPLEYNIPYVGMNMVFCGEDYKERSFMMHMHAYGKAIDGFYEYVIVPESCKESIWLTHLVGDLGIVGETLVLHYDSQSTIQLSWNFVFHATTKHVDVKYNFIRDVLEAKHLELVKVSTDDNPVDLLRKGLSSERFVHLKELMDIG